MAESTQPEGIENLSFSIFGQSYTLKCKKDQQQNLLEAINVVQNKTAKLLRDNPTLSPQQVAILTAIEIQSSLLNFTNHNTPFQKEAFEHIRKMKRSLLCALKAND